MEPSDFFTRSKSNEGSRMSLRAPDGTVTDQYLIVSFVDCDEYRAKLNDQRMRIAGGERIEKEVAIRELVVSLVRGWSFSKEFTVEALTELLIEAPSIQDEVDRFSVRRANFFKPMSEA